jgi:glucose/arabinose dehydrogenase
MITQTQAPNLASPSQASNDGACCAVRRLAAIGRVGYLYASTGDGGTGGANTQDLDSLLGKILRIGPSGTAPGDYSVPSEPFRRSHGRRG